MPQSNFGVGILTAIPTGANPTPQPLSVLQDVAVDFQFDLKQLYGSFQFPIEQARGKGKIDIKASIGRFDPVLFNATLFGLTTSTGEKRNSVREAGTIPTTPFQITVANGATFAVDLGVYDTTSAKWLSRVASAPATGQYSVNTVTGVYTFAAADVGHVLQFFYTYTAAGTGSTLAYTNQLMGAGPTFALHLVNVTPVLSVNKYLWMSFPAVIAPKLNVPMKLDDYSVASIDMSAQDDGTGAVFNWSMTG